MSNREVLSLQFGHYANYVGAHWWNMQELGFNYVETSEINNDILFREGFTNKGQVTFTPRVLLADLKGSLRSLSTEGNLYEATAVPEKIQVCWDKLEVQADDKIEKNNFQEEIDNPSEPSKNYKLDDEVKVWSDFLYTRFHPRTVNVVKEFEHDNNVAPFDIYPLGVNMWKSDYFQEDFSDKIRNYIEECDSFQGFQILLDSTNAFSGLATSCMEHLCDEYDNKSIFAFPLIPSHYSDYNYVTDDERHQSIIKDSIRVLNLGLCYNGLIEHSSLFVPMSTGVNGWRQPGDARQFNHVKYNHELWYHSSAILASALDTFTLKYRLKSSGYSILDLAADLTSQGRKAVAASLCLPFSLNRGADLIDCLDNWDGPLSQSITPNCKIGNIRMMQLITLRGVSEDRLKRKIGQAGKQRDMPAYKCNSVNEMLNMYMSFTCHASATNVTNVSNGICVKRPFPNIFDDSIDIHGNVTSDKRVEQSGVETLPVLAGLHAGTEVGNMIESLHTEIRKIKFARFHQYVGAGLEKDEFTESLDKLFDFRERYEDNYLI